MYNKVSQKGFTNLIRRIIKEEVDQAAVAALNNLIDAWNKVPRHVQQSIISKKGYDANVISKERELSVGSAAYMGGSPKK